MLGGPRCKAQGVRRKKSIIVYVLKNPEPYALRPKPSIILLVLVEPMWSMQDTFPIVLLVVEAHSY
jgi:hypothetical protein